MVCCSKVKKYNREWFDLIRNYRWFSRFGYNRSRKWRLGWNLGQVSHLFVQVSSSRPRKPGVVWPLLLPRVYPRMVQQRQHLPHRSIGKINNNLIARMWSAGVIFRCNTLIFPQVFHQIFARKTPEGEIINTIPCENKETKEVDDIPEEDQTFCEVCGNCDREDRLLLCDGCDNGWECRLIAALTRVFWCPSVFVCLSL